MTIEYDTLTIQILAPVEPTSDVLNVLIDGPNGEFQSFFRVTDATVAIALTNTPQSQGDALYRALFHGSAATALERAFAIVTEAKKGLRICIQSTVAAVLALPWETLYEPQREFWARDRKTPISRYLPLPQPISPLKIESKIRVLVVLASPNSRQRLDVEAEWNTLVATITPLVAQGVIELTRLTPPTLNHLQKTLIAETYHILHFVGHGDWDGEQAGLLFEHPDGSERLTTAGELADLLQERGLRLAILNACEGAAVPQNGSPFNGIAQRLAKQSDLTVVAMQAPIADHHAQMFANVFYQALCNTGNIEIALTEGRIALTQTGDPVAWTVPALYIRAESSTLFNIPPFDLGKRIAFLWGQAEMMRRHSNWGQAIPPLEKLIQLDPNHADALKRLGEMRKRVEIEEELYPQLMQAMKAEAWEEARLLIKHIDQTTDKYKDVPTRKLIVDSKLKPSPPDDKPLTVDEHADFYEAVITALQYGELVPFLGVDAALCGRMPGVTWGKNAYLPSYQELAIHLATELGYRPAAPSLVQVAQYGSVMNYRKLYGELETIFQGDYTPTPLHTLLATLPAQLQAKNYPETSTSILARHHFIVVSVAYDALMEVAFDRAEQPYHLLVYRAGAEAGQTGELLHTPPGDKSSRAIESGTDYDGFDHDSHPVLLKLAGEKPTRAGNTTVITEDHYIAYDTLNLLRKQLPRTLQSQLLSSSLLFMGYALQEWQLRLVLHRLGAANRRKEHESWTLEPRLETWESKIWEQYNVTPIPLDLDTFTAGLSQCLERMPPA